MTVLKYKPSWIIAVVILAIGLAIFPFCSAYAASGGGCTTSQGIGSCISATNSSSVIPDAYINSNAICNVDIQLKGSDGTQTDTSYNGCYGAGSHLTGESALGDGAAFSTLVCINNHTSCVSSPPLTE